MSDQQYSPEEMARQIRLLAGQLLQAGRQDLLLHAIGVPLLEELRIEAAKGRLSRLVITEDYRFILGFYYTDIGLSRGELPPKPEPPFEEELSAEEEPPAEEKVPGETTEEPGENENKRPINEETHE